MHIHAHTCTHTHTTPLNFNTLLIKRKNRQKYTNSNINPWKLWPKRIVSSSCKKFHPVIGTSNVAFDLWLPFSCTVCMLEILVPTRKKLGCRLKSESYLKIAEKINLHTIKPFSQKVTFWLASPLKTYKYVFFSNYNSLAFQYASFCYTSMASLLISYFLHWLLF